MSHWRVLIQLACATVSLVLAGCVESLPPPGNFPPPPAPIYSPQGNAAPASSPLDPVLAPIALYPDPLIALILPASTSPADVTAAATYLVQYGDLARIDSQPWDPSVRALAHYPMVVSWMAENIAWTQALGTAFASSPADVMDSIQRLRARAAAAGVLVSTPQQRVAYDNGEIEILPAEPDSLYVPAYDPDAAYPDQAAGAYDASLIFFGDPYPMGPWLAYSFDWRRHRVWEGGCWQGQNGWRPRHFYGDRPPVGTHPWRPREGGTVPSGPAEFRRANETPGTRIPIPRTPARNTGRIPGSMNSGNAAGAHPGAAATSAPAEGRPNPPQR